MDRSDSIKELATALAKAQGQMENAKKDSANEFFKKPYADLASVVDAIKKPLSENGIAYIQTTDTEEGTVIVETTLLHSSGEWLSSRLRMRPVKDDPQGVGSAITYARRYGLQAIVGLAADDDDGNAASGNAPKAANAKAEPTPIRPPAQPKPQQSAPQTQTAKAEPTTEPNKPEPALDPAQALIKQIYADAKYLDISNDQLDQAARKEDMNCRDLQEASLQALQKIAKGLSMRRTKAEAEGKPA